MSSVMSALNAAGVARAAADGRKLLQAERVSILVLERDAARAAHVVRPHIALEPLGPEDLADPAEWGPALTGGPA